MRPLLSIVLTISLVCSGFAQVASSMDAFHPGTEVEIELLEDLSSETLQAGQLVSFKVVRALENSAGTLLPAGTGFTGTVTSAHAAGHWGKAGAFDLKLGHLKLTNGTLAYLDFHRPAKLNDRGEKTGEALETGMAMTYCFPLIPAAVIAGAHKGKPFKIRAGERYLVYVTEMATAATDLANPSLPFQVQEMRSLSSPSAIRSRSGHNLPER